MHRNAEYTHPKFKDVWIRVLKIFPLKSRVKVKVLWLPSGFTDNLEISYEKRGEFKRVR